MLTQFGIINEVNEVYEVVGMGGDNIDLWVGCPIVWVQRIGSTGSGGLAHIS